MKIEQITNEFEKEVYEAYLSEELDKERLTEEIIKLFPLQKGKQTIVLIYLLEILTNRENQEELRELYVNILSKLRLCFEDIYYGSTQQTFRQEQDIKTLIFLVSKLRENQKILNLFLRKYEKSNNKWFLGIVVCIFEDYIKSEDNTLIMEKIKNKYLTEVLKEAQLSYIELLPEEKIMMNQAYKRQFKKNNKHLF